MNLLLTFCGITESYFYFIIIIIIITIIIIIIIITIIIVIIISYRKGIKRMMNLGAPNLGNKHALLENRLLFWKMFFRSLKIAFQRFPTFGGKSGQNFATCTPSHLEQLVASLLAYSWSLPQIAFSCFAQHWIIERDNFGYI